MSKRQRPSSSLRNDVALYRRVFVHAWPYKWIALLAILGMVTQSATSAALSWILKPLVDEALVARDPAALKYMPILIIGIFVVRAVANFVSDYHTAWVARRVTYDLRQKMFAHLARLPSAYYDTHSSANMISKMIFNVEQVGGSITDATIALVRDGSTVAMLLGLMVFYSWKLTIVFAIMLPLSSLVMRIMSRRFRKLSVDIQHNMGDISQVAHEAAEGHRIVKAFNAQDTETAAFERVNQRNMRQNMKKKAVSAGGVSLLQMIASWAFALVIFVALRMELMSAGTFISYMGAVMLLMAPTKSLAKINELLQKGLAAAESTFELFDQPAEPDNGAIERPTVRGRIEFRNVGFRYATAETPALYDISFTVEPGQTVALVGASGSGKTTVASLLPRFYRLSDGEILIDGTNINDFKLTNLRAHIAIVGQESLLFNDSIGNNIAYGPPGEIDRARVEQAARSAYVLEFANELPLRLDAPVGERGTRLSGGQRQRVAIARALYKDAPILILDEATSALDAESERFVQEAMQRLRANRTTLVIAHRLSTIERADRIVVLARGRIVETGTHDELLELNRVYAGLYRQQFAEVSGG